MLLRKEILFDFRKEKKKKREFILQREKEEKRIHFTQRKRRKENSFYKEKKRIISFCNKKNQEVNYSTMKVMS